MQYLIKPSTGARRLIKRIAFCLSTLGIVLASLNTFALEIEGVWQQGALIRGHVEPGSTVVFDGHAVNVTATGDFILGLGRDAAPEVALTVTSVDGAIEEHQFEVLQREYQIQRIKGVKKEHVTPPESVTQRIRAEAAQVWKARQIQSDYLDFMQSFEWPLIGPITGVYGSQRFYNGVPRSPHYGVDIAAATGTPVKAPAAGVVTLAHDDMFYSGGTLILDHGYGLSSTFIHLHKILVKPGQRVEQGQLIAEVGASGRATGPHLDWRLNWFHERLDPQLLMNAQASDEKSLSAAR
jgi:murein DD-endopeptidase MepM/ murein hydrolase activator NlpD